MKSKLPILLLGVVLFSTAALGLLAARSLARDQLVARQHLMESAENATRTAATLIAAQWESELDQVRNAMADVAASGGDLARIHSIVTRLEISRPLVKRIFLFMNPWGFVWPDDESASPEESRLREELVGRLRALAASVPASGRPIGFTFDGAIYVFGGIEGRKVLYVGFEMDRAVLAARLDACLHDASGGGILLAAEGGLVHDRLAPSDAGVEVADSLGQRTDVPSSGATGGEAPLATRRLAVPLEDIRILAHNEDPGAFERSVAVRHRLYRAGIVMLALGIVGGVVLLLTDARQELLRARAGSEFAIGVSHDLRTPLASMKMMAETVALGHVTNPERQREFLHVIVDECERLSQLIERVLYLFRFGQDAVRYHLEPADLADEVCHTVDSYRARSAAGDAGGSDPGPDVCVDIRGQPPSVLLDKSAFMQVMLNLLDNAAKYGKPSPAADATTGAPARMRIDVTVDVREARRRRGWPLRSWAAVTVRDYGRGITPRRQHRVFRRYYREPERRSDHVSGLGLGLSVCRHAARAHGGWMAVWSREGEGTAFTVYLPAQAGGMEATT